MPSFFAARGAPLAAAVALSLAPALSCSSTQPAPPPPSPTFRAVFITDTHVIGPQYTCCQENSPADNSSIVKTVDRLNAVRDAVNAIRPPPAMVFVLGDVVHAANLSRDPQWYRDNPNAFSIARDVFKTFAMPVYLVAGNHDYGVDCTSSDTYDRALSEGRFQEFLGQPPYQAVDYMGWKFLLVNSQRGATFDANDPRCDTGAASVGPEQMTWAAAQLDAGAPTLVMSHYMRLLYADVEDGPTKSFPLLLDSHPNVKAFFAGHSHRWLDLTQFNNGVMHQVLGGTRYDANNFWLVEFTPADGTFRVLDQDKAIKGSSCAQPWTYDGDPKPAPSVVDTGDCVNGVE